MEIRDINNWNIIYYQLTVVLINPNVYVRHMKAPVVS